MEFYGFMHAWPPGSTPRLCIHALCCCTPQFLACYALKCSSWSAINQGTSGRSPSGSIGNRGYPSVDAANKMASRILGFNFEPTWPIFLKLIFSAIHFQKRIISWCNLLNRSLLFLITNTVMWRTGHSGHACCLPWRLAWGAPGYWSNLKIVS